MKGNGGSDDPFEKIIKFFASIRLSVVLLLTLAATSVIGTVIPQNESPEAYRRAFGEGLFKLFSALNLFDMYHSLWFQFLLLILTVNVVVCSLDRLSGTWRIVFTRKPAFDIDRFRKLPNKAEFTDPRSVPELEKAFLPVLAKEFGYARIDQTDKGAALFAEKGRWTRLGVYTVHLSVILLLLGGLIGSIFGFEGHVNIPEGETVSRIQLRNGGRMLPLDFSIRCDSFKVSFYESGTPKEYRSSLVILENGKEALKKDIIVNDPLRYAGVNLFQSSYGTLPPEQVTLSFTSSESGREYKKTARIGETLELPEGGGTLVLRGFQQSASFSGTHIGETFVGVLTPKEGQPVRLMLPVRFPSFDKMRKGSLAVSVSDYKSRYYTGLQVTRDPGVGVVYAGFILMILGCYITFFISHQRVCVELRQSGKGSRIVVAGTANRNKLGMERKVEKIAGALGRPASGPARNL